MNGNGSYRCLLDSPDDPAEISSDTITILEMRKNGKRMFIHFEIPSYICGT